MSRKLILLISAIVFNAYGKSNDLTLNITGTSITELFNLKITSLSKKKQSLNRAASAVYVLTHDEIGRLGVTTIADALRYVPGVEVASIDASRWAISIRGFNGRAANKLLVMIDGRSIYSPLFSGVLWEEKDVLLSDVDRIEVIRGPGGAIWGANAVNGVINIITRKAKASQGSLLESTFGVEQRKIVQARYGVQVSDDAYLRIYAKHRQREHTNSEFSNDDNQQNQFGFRFDYDLTPDNTLTVQGDVYSGRIGSLANQERPLGQEQSGGNLLVNWQFSDENDSKHQVLAYYDKTHLVVPSIDDSREILNLDYQLQQKWQQHEFVAGIGYRVLHDDVNTEPLNFIIHRQRHDQILSAFFQDDIAFLDDDLHLIWGTKYEKNDYSGTEWQPSIRVSYQLPAALLWGAWSKAVRVPTRFETDIRFGSFSGEHLKPERANVYELGWRKQWHETWSFDATVYRASYDDVLSIEDFGYDNKLSGHVQGIELSNSVQIQPSWLLRINFSHAVMALSPDIDSLSAERADTMEQQLPKNMLQLISMWDIDENWQFNSQLRYVDQLSGNNIDSYWSLDASLNWRVFDKFHIKLAARNLGEHQHYEWDALVPIERDIFINFKWEL